MPSPQTSTLARLRPVATRAVVLVLVVAGLIALGRSDALHEALIGVLEASSSIISAHPVLGPVIFIGLAALSAMLGFVSSAVLVPAAVYAWNAPITMVLLWVGWTIGGITAWTLASVFGRPVLRWLVPGAMLSRYQSLLEKRPSFSSVLLFQLALPSEIPGYLLGLMHYPLHRYLGALMIAELPYAVGTVMLGVGFVERDTATLLAVSGVGAVALIVIAQILRRRHGTI